MTVSVNRQVVIDRVPEGALIAAHFITRDAPLPEPATGEALCRVILVSLDPVNRSLMAHGGDYRGSLGPGDVMAGFGLVEVVTPAAAGGPPASRSP